MIEFFCCKCQLWSDPVETKVDSMPAVNVSGTCDEFSSRGFNSKTWAARASFFSFTCMSAFYTITLHMLAAYYDEVYTALHASCL